MNWVWLLRRAGGSMVPPLGAVLLCLAVAAIPLSSVRWWAPAAIVLDPWIGVMVLGMLTSKAVDR
jgi:hypothetical protein